MSENLKCPKCGGRLVYWGATGALLKCEQCKFGWGTEELWQALTDTKKKLDMAINAMESAQDHNVINCVTRGVDPTEDDVHITLFKALEKIKQKEEK